MVGTSATVAFLARRPSSARCRAGTVRTTGISWHRSSISRGAGRRFAFRGDGGEADHIKAAVLPPSRGAPMSTLNIFEPRCDLPHARFIIKHVLSNLREFRAFRLTAVVRNLMMGRRGLSHVGAGQSGSVRLRACCCVGQREGRFGKIHDRVPYRRCAAESRPARRHHRPRLPAEKPHPLCREPRRLGAPHRACARAAASILHQRSARACRSATTRTPNSSSSRRRSARSSARSTSS